jgi:hypothetical protein
MPVSIIRAKVIVLRNKAELRRSRQAMNPHVYECQTGHYGDFGHRAGCGQVSKDAKTARKADVYPARWLNVV